MKKSFLKKRYFFPSQIDCLSTVQSLAHSNITGLQNFDSTLLCQSCQLTGPIFLLIAFISSLQPLKIYILYTHTRARERLITSTRLQVIREQEPCLPLRSREYRFQAQELEPYRLSSNASSTIRFVDSAKIFTFPVTHCSHLQNENYRIWLL